MQMKAAFGFDIMRVKATLVLTLNVLKLLWFWHCACKGCFGLGIIRVKAALVLALLLYKCFNDL